MTANYLRRSRVSENKNRRQSIRRSIRRGGAPPQAPPPPPAPARRPAAPLPSVLTGKNGSACAGKDQPDCTAMKKACEWRPANKTQSAHCKVRIDRGVGLPSSADFNRINAENEARRAQALRDVYSSDDEPEESDVSSQASEDEDVAAAPAPVRAAALRAPAVRAAPARAPAVRAPAARAAPARAQAVRAVAAAPRVPVLSPYKPLGCVQRVSQVNTKKGTSYTRTACVDSRDPALNEPERCFINPATNKCKNVVRA